MGGLDPMWVGLATVTFALGLGLGLLVARSRGAGQRVRALEQELSAAHQREEAFKESVGKHFDRTSDLFRDLTREYTALYAHLAEGARELCPDREPELSTGLSAELLRAGEPPAAESEATADEPEEVAAEDVVEPDVPREGASAEEVAADADAPEVDEDERERVAGAA